MADPLELHGLKNCSSCRKARKWLEERGIDVRLVDYRDEPVAAETLARWAGRLGWDKLINRRSPTWRGLDEGQKAATTDAQWATLVAEHPTLVRRPVLAWPDGRVELGFNEAEYAQWFGPGFLTHAP